MPSFYPNNVTDILGVCLYQEGKLRPFFLSKDKKHTEKDTSDPTLQWLVLDRWVLPVMDMHILEPLMVLT